MTDIHMSIGRINNFVAGFAGLKSVPAGEQSSDITNPEKELRGIYREYDSARHKLDASKANNDQEWQTMLRKLQSEYGPRYQAWSDRHKLGYQFIWDTQD